MTEQVQRTREIRALAAELGFDACGIADATAIDPNGRLNDWLGRGYGADMLWIHRTQALRADPRLKVDGAKSVIVLAMNYFVPDADRPMGSGKIARYARGRDYHKTVKRRVIELCRAIEAMDDGIRCYGSVDTGPVMERAWAERAGVGSIGKNSLALRTDMGSWFFIATVITTASLVADAPAEDICGTCTLCIDACPTNAIVEPKVVDSRLCISYQTIENRGEVPQELHEAQGEWLFGCDICQEVCPWNRFATPTDEPDFQPRVGQDFAEPDTLIEMDEAEFNTRFAGTAIRRTKHSGMVRNAHIVRRNLTQKSLG